MLMDSVRSLFRSVAPPYKGCDFQVDPGFLPSTPNWAPFSDTAAFGCVISLIFSASPDIREYSTLHHPPLCLLLPRFLLLLFTSPPVSSNPPLMSFLRLCLMWRFDLPSLFLCAEAKLDCFAQFDDLAIMRASVSEERRKISAEFMQFAHFQMERIDFAREGILRAPIPSRRAKFKSSQVKWFQFECGRWGQEIL